MRFLPDASFGLQDMSPTYFFIVLGSYYALEKIPVPASSERIIVFLAKYSYYVYLFHNTLILLFFTETLGIYDVLIAKTGSVLFLVIVFVCSLGVSLILGILVKKALDLIFKGS